MIDFAKIKVSAGDGGRGGGSFHQIKGKRYGKADGGNGGRGANAFLLATPDLNTLEAFRYVKDFAAEDGKMGSSNLKKGSDGRDLTLKVPVGTQVKVKSDTDHYAPVTDLVAEGDKIQLARGGRGGRGNAHLRDEYGRRPRAGEAGEAGEEVSLTLELKLIADAGLIGLPNAGKSTLLAALTAARPKIAEYPFTTLEPNLGVMTINHSPLTINRPTKLVIADIPGLIEGASEGRGLGDLFLRHIERTKILVHLIDASGDSGKWQDYQTIRTELKKYSKELGKKKEIIVLSKVDLVDEDIAREIKSQFVKHRKKVLAISAVSGSGLPKLIKALHELT